MRNEEAMAALDGIRVLDLGHYLAGPLVARLLADNGAEVVRVDRPGTADRPEDAYLQQGKKRIALDLKDQAGLETVRRLAARSDVLVENFRPGVLDRLGLSAAELRAVHPGLVYCSIPGFASSDPRAELPGWEGVIAAATGNSRVRVGEAPADWDMSRPTYPSLPLASNFAAILSATAIVAALTSRESTGLGARIEVPLFDATFELMSGAGAYPLARGYRIEDPLNVNGSGTYECADGRFVQFNPVGASLRFLSWFLDAAGKSDWIAEGLALPGSYLRDPELASVLRHRLAALFLTRTAREWEDLGNAAGVPMCLIRSSAEWLDTEHARASRQVVEVDDPEFGPSRLAGSPLTLSATPSLLLPPRHLPGEDREEVIGMLAEEPSASRTVAADAKPAQPYAGLRVVDLTQILAGPSAGRVLAEYGADVVKVNSPQRRVDAHGIVNRGKKSILIDLQRGEGQDLLWRLIDRADVVTQNFPQGTAERYGIGFRHVHARNPSAVYVSVSCYGYGGSWARRRGYEVQGQAAVGIMERTGRGGRPGVLGPYNPLDYGTGAMAALAAAIGIFHRVRTGEGQHVATSLAQVGTFHQASFLIGHPRKAWDEVGGRDALGPCARQRFYRAEDGWFFLGSQRSQDAALAEATGIASALFAQTEDRGLAAALEELFAEAPRARWVSLLQGIGIGAHEIVSLPELLEVPYVVTSGLAVRQLSPTVGEVIMPGPAVYIDGTRVRPGSVAPAPGADAEQVLDEIGLAARLPALAGRWVVQTQGLQTGWE